MAPTYIQPMVLSRRIAVTPCGGSIGSCTISKNSKLLVLPPSPFTETVRTDVVLIGVKDNGDIVNKVSALMNEFSVDEDGMCYVMRHEKLHLDYPSDDVDIIGSEEGSMKLDPFDLEDQRIVKSSAVAWDTEGRLTCKTSHTYPRLCDGNQLSILPPIPLQGPQRTDIVLKNCSEVDHNKVISTLTQWSPTRELMKKPSIAYVVTHTEFEVVKCKLPGK